VLESVESGFSPAMRMPVLERNNPHVKAERGQRGG
jgi:hypothetical protein